MNVRPAPPFRSSARWSATARAAATAGVAALLVACAAAPSSAAPSSAAPRAGHPNATTAHYSVLFDDTSAETAGNADWIVSTAMPAPTAQDANPTTESDWTGALSAWGVALQKTGRYTLSTLAPGNTITYGGSGALDLSKFNAFVIPEPNILFTAAEKTAIMTFVKNGGGLFMISDHSGSDRNNDGSDSVQILNDLMTNNSVDSSDPFGLSIDTGDISSENPDVIGASAANDPIIHGPFGTATGTIIRDGTTATIHPADNPAARGEIFRTGYSASGTTGAAVASSTFGSGRVAYWGDSSPIDDGTGESGKTLYDGWDDPAGTDATVALNATEWLAGGTSTGGGGGSGGGTPTEHVTDGGFESGTTGWTATGGAAATSARAHTGSDSAALCAANNCTASLTQSVTIPAGSTATLSFWTYLTTQETGTTAYDKLSATIGSSTVATISNASGAGSWQHTTVDVSSFAGQTVSLAFSATDGTKLPTSFWLDDVSLMA